MGDSGKAPDGSYRFVDHARYLDAWFDALKLTDRLTLIVHDWGSALGFHWAYRHQPGIAYMEAIVTPLRWADWEERSRGIFQTMRTPGGEEVFPSGLADREGSLLSELAKLIRAC